MSNQIRCPYCNVSYSTSGIKAHVRIKHPDSPMIDIYTPSTVSDSSTVTTPNTAGLGVTPQNTPTLSGNSAGLGTGILGDPLMELEQQLTRQLRIVNLKNMIRELNTPTPTAPAVSDIDQFKKFVDMYKSIQDSVLDNVPEEVAQDPFMSILMSFLPNILKPKEQPNFNNQSIVGETPTYGAIDGLGSVPKTPAPTQMNTNQLPKEYIDAVKSGEITEEKAWKDFCNGIKFHMIPQEYAKTTREEFHKEFDKVKNG